MRERAELLGGTLKLERPSGRRNARAVGSASGARKGSGSCEMADITVLLVDDHALVRKGFRRLLEDEQGIQVVGEASDGEPKPYASRTSSKPQVIVMDMSMPGIEWHPGVRRDPEGAAADRHPDAQHVLRRGVGPERDQGRSEGYVLKNADDVDLAAAIRDVAAGERVVGPGLLSDINIEDEKTEKLTPREKQMLQLIAKGKSNKEIAAMLGLSANTVAVHRANIMQALGIHNTAELVRLRDPQGPGDTAVTRREFLLGAPLRSLLLARPAGVPGFRLVDVTGPPGIDFTPQQRRIRRQVPAGDAGRRAAPSSTTTATAGWTSCWSTAWTGRATSAHAARCALYRNNRNGTFTDVTAARRPGVEMYGMGVAVGRLQQRRLPGHLHHRGRPEPAVPATPGKGTFVDVTHKAGLAGRSGFSTSAMWFDYDRDGLLDLFVCNYVKWSPEHDVFCSVDGKQQVVLHAGSVSRRDLLAVPQPRQRHVRGRHREERHLRHELEIARRRACSTTTATAGRTCSSPTTRSRTSSTATAQRHVRRGRRAGGPGVQRGRQGARRHGRRRGRFRQLRASPAWPSPTSTTR